MLSYHGSLKIRRQKKNSEARAMLNLLDKQDYLIGLSSQLNLVLNFPVIQFVRTDPLNRTWQMQDFERAICVNVTNKEGLTGTNRQLNTV
jgi:hypothetical protein